MHAFTHGELSAAIKPSDTAGTVSTDINIENNPWLETVALTTADPQDDYNFYEIQWTPDYIAFLYNGEQVRKVENSMLLDFMTKEQKIKLSFEA